MGEKLKSFIDALFANAPKTQEALDAKEELLTNVTDKYNDCIAQGKSEETAFNLAIASIGDITEILEFLGTPQSTDKMAYTDDAMVRSQKRSGMLTAIAVMLYILSVVPVIIFDELLHNDSIGVIIMFVFVAIATGLLIYNNHNKITVKKNKSKEDAETENDEERSNKKGKELILSLFWICVVGIYLMLSFSTSMWYITWVIFIIAAGISNIIDVFFTSKKKKKRNLISSALWCFVTSVYFIVSFDTGAWHITWIIFLIGLALENCVKAIID